MPYNSKKGHFFTLLNMWKISVVISNLPLNSLFVPRREYFQKSTRRQHSGKRMFFDPKWPKSWSNSDPTWTRRNPKDCKLRSTFVPSMDSLKQPRYHHYLSYSTVCLSICPSHQLSVYYMELTTCHWLKCHW